MGANDETADADALPVADPGNSPAIGLFERLPEWVLDTLSNEQKEAIHQAAEEPAWVRSPVDIRFTIPFGDSFFDRPVWRVVNLYGASDLGRTADAETGLGLTLTQVAAAAFYPKTKPPEAFPRGL